MTRGWKQINLKERMGGGEFFGWLDRVLESRERRRADEIGLEAASLPCTAELLRPSLSRLKARKSK